MNHSLQKLERNQIDVSKEIHAFAEITARQLAFKNQPKSIEQYKAQFFNILEKKIQLYIDKAENEKNPISNKVIAFETQKLKNDKINHLQAELGTLELKENEATQDLEMSPCSTSDRVKNYIIKAIILMLSFSESFLVFQALRSIGIPTIGAIICSLGIGLGIAVLTEYIADYLKKSTTSKILWTRVILICGSMFLLFYFIALLRIQGIEKESLINKELFQTDSITQIASPFILAGISTGMFVIGLLISMKYGLTKNEKIQLKDYLKKRKLQKKIKQEIEDIKCTIQELEDHAHHVSSNAVKTYDDAIINEQVLLRIGESAQALFANVNLNFRTDNYCPDFYSQPIKLQLTFFQNKLKTTHHDTNIQ